jgi:hypothetical protein
MCQIKPDFEEKNSGIATIATNRIPLQIAQNILFSLTYSQILANSYPR